MSDQSERLQRCVERIFAGEAEDVVLRDEGADAELRALVRVALAARRELPVRAPAAMRARQQRQLQSMMRSGGASAAADGSWRPRWRAVMVRAAGALMAALLALGSAVAVSAETLPGDALYGLKRATEEARVVLTRDPLARTELRAAMATERLSELRRLVDRGVMPTPERIDDLLAAHRALQAAARSSGAPEAEALLASGAERAADALRVLSEEVQDAAAARRLERAAAQVAPEGDAVPEVPEPRRVASATPAGGDGAAGGLGAASATFAPTATRSIARATATSGPTDTPPTATRAHSPTPPPSPTVKPSATVQRDGGAGGGAGLPEPTEPPTAVPTQAQATSEAPPATEPPPTAAAPTEVAPTERPNPRATRRSATRTPEGP